MVHEGVLFVRSLSCCFVLFVVMIFVSLRFWPLADDTKRFRSSSEQNHENLNCSLFSFAA